MSSEKVSQEKTKNQPVDPEAQQRLNEEIERIKQPPAINETLKEETAAERVSNPTLVPEMLGDMRDLRGDLERD